MKDIYPYLVRIANKNGAEFRQTGSAACAKPVHGTRRSAIITPGSGSFVVFRHDKLQLLVERQVHRRLHGAQVTRRNASVETPESFFPDNLRETIQTILVSPLHQRTLGIRPRPVQLQPRFHEPDRIRAGGREHARGTSREHMAQHCVLVADPLLRNEAFDVSVGVEFDRAGGDDAYEVRTESAEHPAPSFGAVDEGKDVEGFAELEDGSRGTRGRG